MWTYIYNVGDEGFEANYIHLNYYKESRDGQNGQTYFH